MDGSGNGSGGMASPASNTANAQAQPQSQNTGNPSFKPYNKIFWPNRCIDQKSGYLVGLNTRSFVACVVDIVTDVPLEELDIILNKMSFDRRMLDCPLGHSPRILGEWIGADKASLPLPPNLHELDMWISMERTESGDPSLRKIYFNEYKIQTSSQIVLYDDTPPYYYTSIPIRFESMLSIVSNSLKTKSSLSQSASKLTKTNNSVFSPTTVNNTIKPSSSSSSSGSSDLETTFKQINCSHDIKTILRETITKHNSIKQQRTQQKIKQLASKASGSSSSNNSSINTDSSDTDSEPSPSFFSKTLFTLKFRNKRKDINSTASNSPSITTTSASSNKLNSSSHSNNRKPKRIIDYILSPIYLIVTIVQFVFDLIEKILNIPTPFGPQLKHLTTFGTHLDNRVFQIKQLSKQWNHLKEKKYWVSNNDDRSSFIEFHNSAWLIFNDILLGIGACILLNVFSHFVLLNFSRLNHLLNNNMLKSLILWLMGWPGGFKLNENLDNFFGRLVLYYIDKWNLITTTISPHGEIFIKVICLCGVLGLSFLISVGIDLFNIFTLHISVFYSVAARFYLLQLLLLKSLWNLFRGVKYNPLRKRTDHCDFDIYQLLLGTLLFTLIFFLFPTTAIYYLFFALFKSGVSMVKAIFFLLLHFLNTFPLFNLLVYFIDKKYLPGGVVFSLKEKKDIITVNSSSSNSGNNSSNDLSPKLGKLAKTPSIEVTPIPSPPTLSSLPIHTLPSTSTPTNIQHNRNQSVPLLPSLGNILSSGGNGSQESKLPLSAKDSLHTFTPTSTTTPNTPPIGSQHRRNQSLSSAASPSIPRMPATQQLEISYFILQIKSASPINFFTPTIHMIQQVVQMYHPARLIKSFFMGVEIGKINK
ncbi:hypothetical protein CYY_000987 [Polysphondylium violaceum]|uniref:Uncharacterized protein n=1 Tax=Polysphondylium violaceum TaxID=133409 RepID=A0A8J4UWM1_9MYCE|nr:hypothetical protein CYY_000987 [Polysphondylium violaceum]